MDRLPEKFTDRLHQILPNTLLDDVLEMFEGEKFAGIRMNLLKADAAKVLKEFENNHFQYNKVAWFDHGIAVNRAELGQSFVKEMIKDGMIYQQNLSSMIPPVILDPKPEEDILDLCAAPGSKTTQMAAMMNNEGCIVALELVKSRMYRLKSVIDLLGVRNVTIKLTNARRYRPQNRLFDKILVDVPCSSEGRFRLSDPKTFRYWSLRKIKEMRKKQKGLLHHACRLLKPGGELVYSTCTFAPEENEEVLDWALRKMEGEMQIEKIDKTPYPNYPAVQQWNKKVYADQIKNCLRILPDSTYDAFFIAKLKRKPWDH